MLTNINSTDSHLRKCYNKDICRETENIHTYIHEQLSTLPPEQAHTELEKRINGLTDPNDIAYQMATQIATKYLANKPELTEFDKQLSAFRQWLTENPQIREAVFKQLQSQERINFALWGTAEPHNTLWYKYIQMASIATPDLQDQYDIEGDLRYAKTLIPDILTQNVRNRPVAFLSRLYFAQLFRKLQKWSEARISVPNKLTSRSVQVVQELLNMQWFSMHPEVAQLLRNKAKTENTQF